jgi:asparagine synthase (glutamine-hydrolysing)
VECSNPPVGSKLFYATILLVIEGGDHALQYEYSNSRRGDMPGIVGMIGSGSSAESAATLEQMMKCMLHEPFYASGTYVNEGAGLRIGWVGHKNSFTDCMPIWNETKDICLIFSGEEFTDWTEIESLKAKGHEFGLEDASYLVHLYEEAGLGFIERLNGWFSGVLMDFRDQRIIMFNDRCGLGRIYYHERDRILYFSSEAKSLLKVLPGLRKLDPLSLAEFLFFDCTMENRTLFSGISLVPAGSIWVFSRDGQVKKDIYFKPELLECESRLNGAEYYRKLKETFARIIPRYFRGRERVAMSLTGGIDTRMIMAWARCAPDKVPCYTFGGMYRDCADVRIARQVAGICRQKHETITVDGRFFSEFPTLARKAVYYTDGTMDVSGSVGLYTHRIAREIAPIRVTGNYGDQALRSDRAFNPHTFRKEVFNPEFARLIRSATGGTNRITQDSGISFFISSQMPWTYYPRFALESSQVKVRSPYLDNDLLFLLYKAPLDPLLNKELSFRLIADGNAALARIPTDRGLLYHPIPILTKCRHLYQEFTFKADYAYNHGMPQWLAQIDHMLGFLHLENVFLGRHKYYHFRTWYRNELSQYVQDILLDPLTRARPYLKGTTLEQMVMSHLKGNHNYTWEIHKILSTELIERHLIKME